jgi:tight adherence protein B
MQYAIIILALLCVGSAIFLTLDGVRRRRFDRRVAEAIPSSALAGHIPSLRRPQERSRPIQRLLNYDPYTAYEVRPIYVVLAASLVALAVCYIGLDMLKLPTLYVAFAGIISALLLARGVLGWQQRRFVNRLFQQLPDAVELITSTVRVGLPVAEAFKVIANDMPQPTSGQFELVCKEMSLGTPAEEAIEGIYHRTHLAEYGMFAVTLAVQAKSGGGLAETLQALGDTVRQRVGLAARAKALAGEVIFSSRALALAPFVVGGLLYLISPRNVDMLWLDPTGRICLAYAVTSVIFGTLVIRWMIRRETSP